MLRIDCPWCGPRAEAEFRCGGESHVQRPPLTCTDAQWQEYLFHHENPKGVHFERWHHVHGCRMWFNVARNTISHEILAVYEMGEDRPDLGPKVGS